MKNPLKIAVLISNDSSMFNDKEYLTPLFALENLIYEEVIWNAHDINWQDYDAFIIRSTYDYINDQHTYDQFLKTLKRIEDLGIPLFNPYPVVHWNSKKNYLSDLASKGINIIETIITTPMQIKEIASIIQNNNWQECIVKPAISCGAHNTFRLTAQEAQSFNLFAHYQADESILIQPFAQEIIDDGEYSLVFFDKQFSHCMRSKPKSGDFRVQFIHGGILKKINPEPWMIEEARRIIDATGFKKLLYARVDVIKRNNKLYVMELELIEPYLYFSYHPEAAEILVKKIKQYLSL